MTGTVRANRPVPSGPVLAPPGRTIETVGACRTRTPPRAAAIQGLQPSRRVTYEHAGGDRVR
jgi:hypothetical protein